LCFKRCGCGDDDHAGYFIFRNAFEHKDSIIRRASEPENTMVAILSIPHLYVSLIKASFMSCNLSIR
jgi:hypothetical protein